MSVEQCRDLNELHPKVKALAEALLEECKKQGLKIGISETYRSIERQDYLYAQGRTRPGKVVTNAKGSSMSSYHQWRLAFDVYQNIKGSEYDLAVLERVGRIGEKLGLEWGGSWIDFKDTPHFQYAFGLTINELKQGKLPKEEEEVIKKIRLNLNGNVKEVDAIEKDGYNYVKLQDLRDSKIDVGYDKVPIVKVK